MTKRNIGSESNWNRRRFLTAALAAWPLGSLTWAAAPRRSVKLSDYPFQLGVASGEPSPHGVVLWTRLAPKPLEGGGMPWEPVQVDWKVASDEKMNQVVRQGSAAATPELGHSLHVEVDGLEPGRWYWYRFETAGSASPIGRTRTAPPPQILSDRLRFAFASCQHYEQGLFTAYQHMIEEDLDLVVHLGDYIYENPGREGLIRRHTGGELHSLEDYRNRYAQYRTDLHLQSAHARFPWLVTWDDHEVDNNYAAQISEEPDVGTEAFLKRRAVAYQAFYEHMPLRRSSLPQGPYAQLYRRVAFGRLAEFSVLDTRQYRSDQPCGDGRHAPCPDIFNPDLTLLGGEQERWLLDGLGRSEARWNILAQQIMMARADRMPGPEVHYSFDQWAGYDANRRRILQYLAENRVSNPVVLTGDIHANWVNDLKVDFDRPEDPTVATEWVGTSISSGGDGKELPPGAEGILEDNPFVRFYNAERGYVRCELTPDWWRTDYRVVEFVTRPGASCLTRASFRVANGRPGAVRE